MASVVAGQPIGDRRGDFDLDPRKPHGRSLALCALVGCPPEVLAAMGTRQFLECVPSYAVVDVGGSAFDYIRRPNSGCRGTIFVAGDLDIANTWFDAVGDFSSAGICR